MTDEQFEARLANIKEQCQAKVKEAFGERDQAMSKLFVESGWSQQAIADRIGKSQDWVSKRLRFGRFCEFLNTRVVKKLPGSLSEGVFRKYWKKHSPGKSRANTPAETKIFQAIIDDMESQYEITVSQPLNVAKLIRENCLDGKPRYIDEILEECGLQESDEKAALNAIRKIARSSQGSMVVEKKAYAKGEKYKFGEIENPLSKAFAIVVVDETLPCVEKILSTIKEHPHHALSLVESQAKHLAKLLRKYR